MLVAETKNLLVNAVSPKGEIIAVWDEDGEFKMLHYRPDSEINISVSKHIDIQSLSSSIPLHSWVLQGIKDSRVENEIKRLI